MQRIHPQTRKWPTWHKEAKEQGIDYIILFLTKGEGFVFCPSNLEYPFGMGGTHGGTHPVSVDRILNDLREFFHPGFRGEIDWFTPFIEKIVEGVDFSLDDLELEKRRVRIISGDWPGF